MKFKFNHQEETLTDACGISDEFHNELFEKFFILLNECNKGSEAVEKIFKAFTKDQLAYLLFKHAEKVMELLPSPNDELLSELEEMINSLDSSSPSIGKA